MRNQKYLQKIKLEELHFELLCCITDVSPQGQNFGAPVKLLKIL